MRGLLLWTNTEPLSLRSSLRIRCKVAFNLKEVVPWGRSFDEYIKMFALSDDDLRKRILGCSDGPASFNCTLTKRGGSVVSIDPIYQFTAEEIAKRISETYDIVMEQMRQNFQEFVWTHIGSVEELGHLRTTAMYDFLADYPTGKGEGRYISAELPQLPCSGSAFDLALCSHFLFLYSVHFDKAFHLLSLRELCRVAHEVRVFPILELGSIRSRHVDDVISTLASEGYEVRIEQVDYEFQKGGNEMLRISHPTRPLDTDRG